MNCRRCCVIRWSPIILRTEFAYMTDTYSINMLTSCGRAPEKYAVRFLTLVDGCCTYHWNEMGRH